MHRAGESHWGGGGQQKWIWDLLDFGTCYMRLALCRVLGWKTISADPHLCLTAGAAPCPLSAPWGLSREDEDVCQGVLSDLKEG